MSSKVDLKEEESIQLPEDYLIFASENMPLTPEESFGTFCSTWEIDAWSVTSSESDILRGPKFKTEDYEWNILLYPNGNHQTNQLSLYLESVDLKSGTAKNDICAQFLLCIVDPTNPTRFMHQFAQHRFDSRESDYGFSQFMDTKVLLGDGDHEPFIVDDTLKIVAIVRLVKDPTGVLWHSFINYDSKEMTGYVGLFNQGATCYMNSLFQSLFFTNQYRKSVYQIPTEHDHPENSTVYALQRLFYNLQFSDSAVSTLELTKSFGWNSIDSFMQHDVQEFNRLLQDNIEKKMKGTPAEDSIKQLFVGKMKSYIKCLHVDYESAKSEDYYDIQLNVKGCKNLEESFKNYILEETLEGENKYMADKHGLQDAKKGVIFESFPPVLHLQLKRFEYDMIKDTMVKINDRHEFPTEIDLKPYLSETADKSESYIYQLHGVLVHTGNLTGGHYFAFVRPEKEDNWFKFDDDRVTPATLNHVLEDNFGGETLDNKLEKRFTNAYMLVYIRESKRDKILEKVTEKDIPTHLMERISQERKELEDFQRLKAQQHLFMKAYITTDTGFLMNDGLGFVKYDESLLMDPPPVYTEQVLKTLLLKDFILLHAQKVNIQPQYIRIWNLANIRNGTIQPDAAFTNEDLLLTMEDICYKVGDIPCLRFYIEYLTSYTVDEYKPDLGIILIFVKLFDPVTQTLRGIGKLYVDKHVPVNTLLYKFNELAQFDSETPIDLYEESTMGSSYLIDKYSTFDGNRISDGDIICFQKQIATNNVSNDDNVYLNVSDYMMYLYQRIWISFSPKLNPNNEFMLELRKDMNYNDIVKKLGKYLNCNPNYILLSTLDYRSVTPVDGMLLLDILHLTKKRKRSNSSEPIFVTKLYFDILSIELSEYLSKKLIKIYTCYPQISNQLQYIEVLLPKYATIEDVYHYISPNNDILLYQVVNNRIVKTFKSNEVIDFVIDEDAILHAEITPPKKIEGKMVKVFHYQRDITRTHSIPFYFMVIQDEEFHETMKRLQKRSGILSSEEWEKVKVDIVTKFSKISLNEDKKLSDYDFLFGEEIGLNHLDPTRKLSTADRGLFIKD